MDHIRYWMTLCEAGLMHPDRQRIIEFITKAKHLADQQGVHVHLEPMALGVGVQITWMERRQDSRVDRDGFLDALVKLSDTADMPVQLAIPGHDPNNETLFRHYGFQTEAGGPDLIMQRQPKDHTPVEEPHAWRGRQITAPSYIDDVAESAPPGKKAERFIKKHKKEFKKRYGKRGTEVLYATAWKKFGESMNLRNYLSLIEDLRS